ncbi:protein of unknown function (plasmid) [Cupriavidus taiwanensis]|uniref:Uncharacterized protein n=1 Tax=Cupriavidus taiwanensis TaxID=164546 RepID=A0A375CK99_9BURK|nr:exported hypothetical protein [Cupriavidus taiwanensis]SOZ18679.1 exported hypothetical protein [Cupriavidus taiwanensis]SPC26009.1 exported hypothetical protein [Cupriavidus taiwanensis]SPD37963.1 protein of unknown function [Cupriavidus taiwanensis]
MNDRIRKFVWPPKTSRRAAMLMSKAALVGETGSQAASSMNAQVGSDRTICAVLKLCDVAWTNLICHSRGRA